MKKFIFVLLFLSMSFTTLFSQQDSTLTVPDEASFDDFDSIEEFDDFEEFDFPFFKSTGYFQRNVPTIELNYGMNNPQYFSERYSGDFNPAGILEAKIGFSSNKKVKSNENLLSHSFNYFFIENANKEIGNSDLDADKLSAEAWRFGFGSKGGYGWNIGKEQSIVLYNGSAITWTKLDFTGKVIEEEENAIEIFGDNFRFGSQFAAGLNVKLLKNIGVDFSYERAQIFPRHMFWYWAGSELVEGIGKGLVSYFIGYVEESSPMLVPAVDFILTNALSYGIYELRSEKMNWPFKTVAPLEFNRFKVGLSFYL